MKNNIRMIFLDIDGTLVYQGQTVPSALEAVHRLKDKGFELSLCTGRSPLHTRNVMKEFKLTQSIFFNGGMVERDECVLDGSPLRLDLINRIVEFFNEANIPLILHTNDSAVSFDPIPSPLRPLLDSFGYPNIQVTTKRTWTEQDPDVYQANIFCSPDWDTKIQNLFPECLLYRWEENGADLQKRGCDKAEGARVLLNHLNIPPEHAVHIGDGGNDVGMFKLVGTAIAMGNAHGDVKQHAHMVTTPCDEDGVLRAFETLGLI